MLSTWTKWFTERARKSASPDADAKAFYDTVNSRLSRIEEKIESLSKEQVRLIALLQKSLAALGKE